MKARQRSLLGGNCWRVRMIEADNSAGEVTLQMDKWAKGSPQKRRGEFFRAVQYCGGFTPAVHVV